MFVSLPSRSPQCLCWFPRGQCICFFGWGGVDCSAAMCCNGHGDCPIPGPKSLKPRCWNLCVCVGGGGSYTYTQGWTYTQGCNVCNQNQNHHQRRRHRLYRHVQVSWGLHGPAMWNREEVSWSRHLSADRALTYSKSATAGHSNKGGSFISQSFELDSRQQW